MFFNGWEGIERTLIVGTFAYLGLILLLRISGKRTLSKMNAFDLVVTVALGSTLATILLSKKVALSEGLTAFFLLIALQYIMAWLSVRSKLLSEFIKSNPELLYYDGQFFWKVMKRERILEVEILQAARTNNVESLDAVQAVVLETDGTFSIIKKQDNVQRSTLSNVNNRNLS